MRQLGELPDKRQAERFVRFLVSNGTEAMSREEGNGSFGVWVIDETHLDDAQHQFREFLRSPDSSTFNTRNVPSAAKPAPSRVVDVRAEVFNRSRAFSTPLTHALTAVSVVLTIPFILPNADREAFHWLFFSEDDWVRNFPEISHGQVWRLITPIFLHAGVLHIFFNMIWLQQLGGDIERNEGTLKLGRFVFLTAAVANTAQYLWDGPNFYGMSGVVYGMLGYVWMMSRYQNATHYGIPQQTVNWMLIWLGLCILHIIPNVANADHLAGLGVGVAWGFIKSGRLKTELRRRRFKG